jgi:DnaK suppressor protein
MPRENDLRKIRELLQRRRRDILETAVAARKELRALKNQERDPEFEENAQAELADYTLSSLLESQRTQLMLIDAAIRRMDEGVFGLCVECDEKIPFERLEALPFAIRCGDCATRHELERQDQFATPSL